jgi:hypothetical protein
MDINNHFDFTPAKGAPNRRPTAAMILAAWKKAGRPRSFSVAYGETEAEFTYLGHPARAWDDSGNGCRGVDRNAVVKALANLQPATDSNARLQGE